MTPNHLTDTSTIYAVSTPPGVSGVAIVRISGLGAGKALKKLAGPLPAPRLAALRYIRQPDRREVVDQALVLWFPGPASFTGEDLAEIHCHGSRAVVQLIGVALEQLGCRPAEPGAFSRRAFDNQKIDLLDAEALDQVIHARDPAMLRIAQGQRGSKRQEIFASWRTDITQLQAACAALIDFPEDDLPEDILQQNRAKLAHLYRSVEDLQRRSELAQSIASGLEVLIVGPPNVGKSTLLNAIAGYERSIVMSLPGTTRDFVELDIQLGDFAVRFVDTAGLREPQDAVEQVGIARTRARLNQAALILNLYESGQVPEDLETTSLVWPVQSKRFCTQTRSLAAGESQQLGLDHLLKEIQAYLGQTYGDAMTGLAFQRERQLFHVKRLAESLGCAQTPDLMPEIQAEQLRKAAQDLAHLSGTIHIEEILDSLFSRFCIGK